MVSPGAVRPLLKKTDRENLTDRWRLGVVVTVVGRINEVNQHRARLVHDG